VIDKLTIDEWMREDALREKASFMNAARRAEERGMKKGIEKGIAEGIKKGIAEGIEKGIAEGIEKGKAEIIGRLKASGMTDKQLEEILSIKI